MTTFDTSNDVFRFARWLEERSRLARASADESTSALGKAHHQAQRLAFEESLLTLQAAHNLGMVLRAPPAPDEHSDAFDEAVYDALLHLPDTSALRALAVRERASGEIRGWASAVSCCCETCAEEQVPPVRGPNDLNFRHPRFDCAASSLWATLTVKGEGHVRRVAAVVEMERAVRAAVGDPLLLHPSGQYPKEQQDAIVAAARKLEGEL